MCTKRNVLQQARSLIFFCKPYLKTAIPSDIVHQVKAFIVLLQHRACLSSVWLYQKRGEEPHDNKQVSEYQEF